MKIEKIINGTIEYTSLQKAKETKLPIFEYLPKPIQITFWWLGLFCFGFAIIIIPIVWAHELIRIIRHKTNHKLYNNYVGRLVLQGKILSHVQPQQLPKDLEHVWLLKVNYPIPFLKFKHAISTIIK